MGNLREGGYSYTYWSGALTLGFNEKPPLELEIATGILRCKRLHLLARCERMPQSCGGIYQSDILNFLKSTFHPGRSPLATIFLVSGAMQWRCPLWVMSRHRVTSGSCPLFPSKRTFISAVCTSA